jgi:hypothetical protein
LLSPSDTRIELRAGGTSSSGTAPALRGGAASRVRARCALIAALLCASACGSDKRVVQPGEFTKQHELLFDDGVDLIEDPDALQGRWLSDWQRELEQRLEDADVVASGRVTTVREEINPEQRASFHLLFLKRKAFKGKPRNELSLSAAEGASGYASVQQNREHVIDRDMIVFVRYAVSADGAVTPHFHLMPQSKAVMRGLQRFDAQQNPHRIQIIEHKQK